MLFIDVEKDLLASVSDVSSGYSAPEDKEAWVVTVDEAHCVYKW